MKKKGKKKLKKWLLSLSLPLLLVIIIASGIFALVSLVQSLFQGDDEKASAELNAYTLEDMLMAVDDDAIITEDALDAMMIDRKTLRSILQGIHDYNHSDVVVEKQIEYVHTYTTTAQAVVASGSAVGHDQRKREGEPDETATTMVTERGWYPYTVKSSTYEGNYPIDWQVVYSLAVFYAISTYQDGGLLLEEEDPRTFITGNTSYYASPYDSFFAFAANETGVPQNLLKALAEVGTNFNPDYADTTGKKKGMMRLTDVLIEEYGMSDSHDPEESILAAARFLSSLLLRYGGDVTLALAAYEDGISSIETGAIRSIPANSPTKLFVTKVLVKFTRLSFYEVNKHLYDYVIDPSALRSFGTFRKGRLQLSDEEVDALLQDVMPKFNYQFDIARDNKTSYTFDECGLLPNDGLISTGDPCTPEGRYEFYEPRSLLNQIALANRDIAFIHDGKRVRSVAVYMREDRWQTIELKYWPTFDDAWLSSFISGLPKGSEVLQKYRYDISSTAGGGSSSGGGGEFDYEGGDPYSDVPLNSNGMTRNWSMSEDDLYLISLSDAETWSLLVGHGFTSRPAWGTYSQEWARTTSIKVPIWTWASSNPTDYRKISTWKTYNVHPRLAKMYTHIFADIFADPSQPVIIPQYSTCFNFRKVVGENRYSYSSHSFGTAIDINWATSIPGTQWTHGFVNRTNALPTKEQWAALPESKQKHEMLYRDSPIVCIFKAYGFDWGADWPDISDGMHFSIIGDSSKRQGQQNHSIYYK